MSSGAFARGAHTMFSKQMIRKAYHKKGSSSSSHDTLRETMKMDGEEVKKNIGEGNCWIPDERTGIYYPKGQEKVMENIPPNAAKDLGAINWFSHHEDACF